MSALAPAPRRKFPWWIYWVILALIFVLSNLPIGFTAYAAATAEANGCVLLGGGAAPPCVIDGVDQGQELQQMSFFVFYLFITWPIGALLGLIWLVVLLIHRGRWKKQAVAA